MRGGRIAAQETRCRETEGDRCPLSTESGFTLLEVLVAVSIVGIALVVLLRLHLLSLDATLAAQDLSTAVLLAQGKMATFLAQSPQAGEDEGQFDGPDLERFTWTTSVTQIDLDPEGPGRVRRCPARHGLGPLARGQSQPLVQPGNL